MFNKKIVESDCFCLGVDVGSTTVKLALLKNGELIYSCYERHLAQAREKVISELQKLKDIVGENKIKVAFSGSSGLGMATKANFAFIQEVYATSELVKSLEQDVSVVIELGGEDAKVLFFDGKNVDERMNGSCAGGTGAFIDQMSSLLNISLEELDNLSLKSEKIYPIASRCGVFAKTDIQALINQGVKKEDICASVYDSIVNQTITGLAQGRSIKGKVMFLGGPLTFCSGLRKRFKETLNLSDEDVVFPEYSSISVALGACIYASKQQEISLNEIIEKLKNIKLNLSDANLLPPLFKDEKEYEEFKTRHSQNNVKRKQLNDYFGKVYLGIDCGSTTTKIVLIGENNEILFDYYISSNGNPVQIVKEQMAKIYTLGGNRIKIASSCVTGYGEELIKAGFNLDYGLVETLAHYKAARYFNPNVDYILDIGGQDIKCFKIENEAISSICLNEACSSGCGSFIQTFAKSMGFSTEEFAKLGLFAKHPVNLGSRCTVFMNSSVKQAQKEGANVGDISAGLSVSVVKNALYKVIREPNSEALGKNIVVQGGTFLNDCVLRAFELELNKNVIRPEISALMGAFGCALYAKEHEVKQTKTISKGELDNFIFQTQNVKCRGCGNACNLNINIFNGGRKYISGNKCEKGLRLGQESVKENVLPNLYEFKRQLLSSIIKKKDNKSKITVGLPLALGMFEFASFWKEFFSQIGFNVVFSGFLNKKGIMKAQYTIPSDTVCYPAKVMHGHIASLLEKKVDIIFYPSLTYNIKEGHSDNHYNCPVVAYYSELLSANLDGLKETKFLFPYLNINDEKKLAQELFDVLKEFNVNKKLIKNAIKSAKKSYQDYKQKVFDEGKRAIEFANEHNLQALIFAGRPYHIDSEVCHNIDKLANKLGFVVLSEDCIPLEPLHNKLNVFNQWTYHSRLYNSTNFVKDKANINVLQLVSFGCGLDAITSDEVKEILERNNKIYTQIKIDEITNLGSITIRLRSLKGVLDEKEISRN